MQEIFERKIRDVLAKHGDATAESRAKIYLAARSTIRRRNDPSPEMIADLESAITLIENEYAPPRSARASVRECLHRTYVSTLDRPWLVFAAVFVVACLIVFARRWPQLAHPAAWVEDGSVIVPHLLTEGWPYILKPLNGYLIIPGKFASWLALKMSFSNYPLACTVVGSVLSALCVAAIAIAPSVLPATILLALATVLVPMDPEVFGLSQYFFWWSSLLLFPALFWRGDGVVLRTCMVLIGGFSSPVVVGLLPAFAARAYTDRSKGSYMAVGIAAIAAIVQIVLVAATARSKNGSFSMASIPAIIEKFFGDYTIAMRTVLSLPVGMLIIATLIAGVWFVRNRRGYLLLGFCLVVMIAESAARTPVTGAMHPMGGGPRYFFYPYIILTWMLIYLAIRGRGLMQYVPIAVLAGALTGLPPRFVRPQEALTPWPDLVTACLKQGKTTFPVHYGGRATKTWSGTYTREMCRSGVSGSLF